MIPQPESTLLSLVYNWKELQEEQPLSVVYLIRSIRKTINQVKFFLPLQLLLPLHLAIIKEPP